jgi:hypothetical protein
MENHLRLTRHGAGVGGADRFNWYNRLFFDYDFDFSFAFKVPLRDSVNYAQPEGKSSRNSKSETFLEPFSILPGYLVRIYVYKMAS